MPSAQVEILRLLAPLLSPDQLLLENAAGQTAYNLAEDRATEAALECAGYLLGLMPETEEEKRAAAAQDAQDEATGLADDLQAVSVHSPER